jgi:hypothetical protein
MKKSVKSFEEFINENYNGSQYGSVLLEANTAALKEFSTKKFQTISEVQSFLKKYGTKVVDGKGGFKELNVTGKLDQDTICAFWAFYYGGLYPSTSVLGFFLVDKGAFWQYNKHIHTKGASYAGISRRTRSQDR